SGERWDIYNKFSDEAVRYCSRAEIAVWIVLFREYKRDKGYASISMRILAERSGCTKKAVVEAIYGKKGKRGSGLMAKGLGRITRVGRYLTGRAEDGTLRGKNNHYKLLGDISAHWFRDNDIEPQRSRSDRGIPR